MVMAKDVVHDMDMIERLHDVAERGRARLIGFVQGNC
jgi:hypothetical protein